MTYELQISLAGYFGKGVYKDFVSEMKCLCTLRPSQHGFLLYFEYFEFSPVFYRLFSVIHT